MNIIGNGIDIVENKRIRNSIKLKGFVERIFTINEINQSKRNSNKVNFFAKDLQQKKRLLRP